MRKLATDGTKMSTSASMTKLTGSSSSFADKPRPRRSAVARNGERMRLARSHSLDDQARASSMLSRGTTLSRSSHAGLSELAQPANDLAHQGVSGRRRIITVGDTLVYLARRRIGRNHLRHGLDIEHLGHRKRPHLDQLASMLANHAGAEDAALGVGHDLDEAFGRALGVGAIVLVVGPAVDAHAPAALFGRILAEPHVSDLWVGESCPWDDGAVHRRRLEEQGSAQHDAGMVIGDMRELGAADHVADGKYPRVRRHKAPADLDAALVVFDARSLEVEVGNVGQPPGGNEKMGPLHHGRRAVLGDVHIDEPRAPGDALHQCTFAYLHAFRTQALQHHLGYLWVILAQRLHGLQHGDAAAQAQIGLGKLQTDGAAADDDQMVELGSVVKNGLVGEIGYALKPRDRRERRRGAAGNDEAARLDARIAGKHRIAGDELGPSADYVDAQTGEPFRRIVGRYGGDDAVNVVVDALVTDGRIGRHDPERRARAHEMRATRRGDE